MTRLALGIDLGTSGVRTAVLNEGGAVVSMARGTYGVGEQDRRNPDLWWAAVMDCIGAQIGALRAEGIDPSQIAGLAVDGTSGSLVLTDTDLVPVTRALMYDDGGFVAEAEEIARIVPNPHVARGPSSALSRALRLVAEDQAGRAAHLLHQADFITARLLGRGGATDFNNALKTGYDPTGADWPDWMADLPIPVTILPKPVAPGAPLDRIAADVAAKLGLPDDLVVHAGTTDSIAAFLAAAPAVPGAAVTSLGTTLAVKLCSDQRIDDPALGLYAHRVGGIWLVGGASNTGGGVLRSLFPVEAIERLSSEIDPTVESPLDYYPLPKKGERFPVNDPDLLPRLTPRPESDVEFLHGLLESMARIEKRSYQIMVERGAKPPSQVITAGGGAKNATWTAIRSRVLGVPVVEAQFGEAAVGAAQLVRQEMLHGE
ncbi:MAG: FGGY-family carbohydrate kinase [Pseudomonadota bacterium]